MRVEDRGASGSAPAVNDGIRAYLRKSKAILDATMERELRALLGDLAVNGTLVESLNEGKKIRGCLTCLVGEALGASPESVLPRAVAVEFIQAATLIHDDYVDQDRLRRNKPAIWTVEGARRAVLIGDVMFASAIGAMSDLSREDGSAVARAIALISKGALYEPLEQGDLDYLTGLGEAGSGLYGKVIRLKTGVLFGAACELGAIAAGAGGTIREAARNYGTEVGEAYQIADDLTEVGRCLTSGSIGPEAITALAPVLARFAPEMIRHLLDAAGLGTLEVTGTMATLIRGARRSMEKAIEELLESAASRMEGNLPAGEASDLVLLAPRAVVALFEESEAGVGFDR